MKNLWHAIVSPTKGDQLFSQVLNFVAGSTMVGFALWLSYLSISDSGIDELWIKIFIGLIIIVCFFWGLLLVAAAFRATESSLTRFADKYVPDSAFAEEAIIILVVWCIPAYFITVVLRGCLGCGVAQALRIKPLFSRAVDGWYWPGPAVGH